MHISQLLTALVVALSLLAALGSLAVLVSSTLRPTTVVVIVFLIIAVASASAVGARSRRWLANPYW